MKIKNFTEINNEILSTVKETYEENSHIEILNIFAEGPYIYGCFLHSLDKKLSFVEAPRNIYTNKIDEDFAIILLELSDILNLLYQTGSLRWLNIILGTSDIPITNKKFIELKQKVKDNIPFDKASLSIINHIDKINKESDTWPKDRREGYINSLVREVNYFLKFYKDLDMDSISIPESENDIIRVKNFFNKLKQELKSIKFDKIDTPIILEIEKMYIDMQK